MSELARSSMSDTLSQQRLVVMLPDASQEGHAFWRLRRRRLSWGVSQQLNTSRLRVSLVLLLSFVFWVGLFAMFFEGFTFLDRNMPSDMRDRTVRVVYNVFFVSLMIMLVFSSGVLAFGGLYRSEEVRLLMTLPARTERIFLHKFQEAVALSSWGFLLLGSPMLISYGIVAGAPWHYYALLAPLAIAFVFIPCGIGAIACMLIVRYVPAIRRKLLFGIALLSGVGALWATWWLLSLTEGHSLTPTWFREMLSRFEYSEQRLLPSWWLSSALLEASRNESYATGEAAWAESVKFLGLMIANALFFHQVAVWTAKRIYRHGYDALVVARRPRQRRLMAMFDAAVLWVLAPLPNDLRQLLLKDLRLFRRDPVQWSQFLVFFGLLALYFSNIRRFRYDIGGQAAWINMISFLNLTVVGLILSTFTTRFIFPMISLEGRRFWVLGLLPVGRDRILWGKFFFAAAGSLVPSALLIAISDVMLSVDSVVFVIHQITCLALCAGLSGIAVGLGARLPDCREESPSKIAAGFGGTLTLVISAAYIAAVVLMTAIPCHLYVDAVGRQVFDLQDRLPELRFWLVVGVVSQIGLSVAVTVVPMRVGILAFRRLEF